MTRAHAAAAAGTNDEDRRLDWSLLRRLWTFVRPHQRFLWISLVLLLATSACQRGWIIMEKAKV